MPQRAAVTYVEDVKQALAAISAIAKTEIELYRLIDKEWKLLEIDKLQAFIGLSSPSYPGYVYEGGQKYGAFRIVEKGANPVNTYITEFYMAPFPGCCAFAISTGAVVHSGYRQRGVNKAANQLRQALAGITGYTSLICTDITKNVPSVRTLARNGFKPIHKTINKRTKNEVNLLIKELE